MEPVEALERIVYLLDRELAPAPKVRAFQRAAQVVRELPAEELEQRLANGTLTELAGIGDSTGRVIKEAAAGDEPGYLTELEERSRVEATTGAALRAALRGDCHSHTLWSDGGASTKEMAVSAAALGHEYLVITDHSPRLTVAHGLDRQRLLAQLDEIEALNEEMAPFRILTGIEVDIFPDGTLDQDDDLLARLDVVVASAHSKLAMDRAAMTRRFAVALANPHVDILGHCTGRKVVGRGRKPSEFDAEIVFAAAQRFDKAIEINCRPERQDPPEDLVEMAVEWDCRFSIDTDAHAPGQLEWQPYGCDKATDCGVATDRVVNTMTADDLLAWTASHAAP
jgi:putative hydrolase